MIRGARTRGAFIPFYHWNSFFAEVWYPWENLRNSVQSSAQKVPAEEWGLESRLASLGVKNQRAYGSSWALEHARKRSGSFSRRSRKEAWENYSVSQSLFHDGTKATMWSVCSRYAKWLLHNQYYWIIFNIAQYIIDLKAIVNRLSAKRHDHASSVQLKKYQPISPYSQTDRTFVA